MVYTEIGKLSTILTCGGKRDCIIYIPYRFSMYMYTLQCTLNNDRDRSMELCLWLYLNYVNYIAFVVVVVVVVVVSKNVGNVFWKAQ